MDDNRPVPQGRSLSGRPFLLFEVPDSGVASDRTESASLTLCCRRFRKLGSIALRGSCIVDLAGAVKHRISFLSTQQRKAGAISFGFLHANKITATQSQISILTTSSRFRPQIVVLPIWENPIWEWATDLFNDCVAPFRSGLKVESSPEYSNHSILWKESREKDDPTHFAMRFTRDEYSLGERRHNKPKYF